MDGKIEDLAHHIINRYNNKKDTYSTKDALFVFGTMGSGKSTYIEKNLVGKDTVYVCTDDYVESVKDIGYIGRDVYKKCREIGIKVTDYLLDNYISMILEGTGSHRDVLQYMQRLKDKGYKIKVHFIKTDLSICQQRVRIRNMTSDRKVPIDDIKTAYNNLWKTDMHIVIKKLVDEWILIENYDDNCRCQL